MDVSWLVFAVRLVVCFGLLQQQANTHQNMSVLGLLKLNFANVPINSVATAEESVEGFCAICISMTCFRIVSKLIDSNISMFAKIGDVGRSLSTYHGTKYAVQEPKPRC